MFGFWSTSSFDILSFRCLFFSYWDENGKIDDTYPPNQALCHAVVAVGYMNSEDQKFVLIRNSWGENWCINGYGCVSERYLSSALLRIAILTEDMTNCTSRLIPRPHVHRHGLKRRRKLTNRKNQEANNVIIDIQNHV